MDYGFMYVETAPLETESDYPYKPKKESCKYEASKGVGKVKGFQDVRKDDTGMQLMAALAKGPVSVAIEADQFAFQGYSGGVITHGCEPTSTTVSSPSDTELRAAKSTS